jgi:ABC-type phosphate transport system permease subunit
MVDIALTHDRPALLSSAPMRRSHRADRSFKRLTFACALFVLLMFAGIIMALVAGGSYRLPLIESMKRRGWFHRLRPQAV